MVSGNKMFMLNQDGGMSSGEEDGKGSGSVEEDREGSGRGSDKFFEWYKQMDVFRPGRAIAKGLGRAYFGRKFLSSSHAEVFFDAPWYFESEIETSPRASPRVPRPDVKILYLNFERGFPAPRVYEIIEFVQAWFPNTEHGIIYQDKTYDIELEAQTPQSEDSPPTLYELLLYHLNLVSLTVSFPFDNENRMPPCSIVRDRFVKPGGFFFVQWSHGPYISLVPGESGESGVPGVQQFVCHPKCRTTWGVWDE
jgi:hypothetical protein